MTISTSISSIIDAIDEHPLRWEAITLESALSLPTLSNQDHEIRVEVFFFPVGGPIDHRQVFAPYYRVSSSTSAPHEVQYFPILPSELDGIDPEAPLGDGNPNIDSREEYDAQLNILYSLTEQLIAFYPKPAEALSEHEKTIMSEFLQSFNRLALPALLETYGLLNPSFFGWLNFES
jgi:hypothetical protein